MIAEVLDDNLHLLRDVVGMQPHPAGKRLGGLGSIDLLIVVFAPLMREPPRNLVGDVAFGSSRIKPSSIAWPIG